MLVPHNVELFEGGFMVVEGDDGGGDDGGGLKRTVGVQGAVPAFGYLGNADLRRQAL